MFQCHLYVKIFVSRICKTNYLLNYVCKGSNRAITEMERGYKRRNKLGHLRDARYVSTYGAL